jgi:arginyl-tRNA synthetase
MLSSHLTKYEYTHLSSFLSQGNTAPYMLYAYARIQGIFRKAAESLYSDVPDADAEVRKLAASEFEFVKQEEIVLAKQLMRLEEVLLDVSDDLFPNKVRMCVQRKLL